MKIFRDPVHDFVSFDDGAERVLLDIIDTFAFQRLRRVHQNGVAFLAYHGLERTRFSHALGTYQFAKLLVSRLREVTAPIVTEMDPYHLSPEAEMGFKAACLLHDIGHPCFSHAGERFFSSRVPEVETVGMADQYHESWTLRIIEEDQELHQLIEGQDWADDMRAFLSKGRHPLRYLRAFFSGNLDVDRLDYLIRDSHASGAGYGAVDAKWLIEGINVAYLPSGSGSGWEPQWEPVFDEGRATYALEHMLLARRSMYAQVYFHPTVRASEALLLRIMQRAYDLGWYDGGESQRPKKVAPSNEFRLSRAFGTLKSALDTSVEEYLRLDDTQVLRAIVEWSLDSSDAILRDLCDRFCKRRLFKSVPLEGQALETFRRDRDTKESRLKEIVNQCRGLRHVRPQRSRKAKVSDYYLMIDEMETSVYSSGNNPLRLRSQTASEVEYYPFEAHHPVGRRFSSNEMRKLDRTFVIVPEEARTDIVKEVASW